MARQGDGGCVGMASDTLFKRAIVYIIVPRSLHTDIVTVAAVAEKSRHVNVCPSVFVSSECTDFGHLFELGYGRPTLPSPRRYLGRPGT